MVGHKEGMEVLILSYMAVVVFCEWQLKMQTNKGLGKNRNSHRKFKNMTENQKNWVGKFRKKKKKKEEKRTNFVTIS